MYLFHNMESEVLKRVTSKLLVPKFPWIDKVNWTSDRMGLSNYWTCEITASKDFEITTDDVPLWQRHLGLELETIFRMVNSNPEDIFMNIKIIKD